MTPTPIPRPAHRRHVEAAADDPFSRGVARGEQLRESVPAALEVYDRLFTLGGISPAQVRDDAERALDAVGRFRPAARAEMAGIAQGSGTDTWHIGCLNARTEILARSAAVPPGECTTIVRRRPAAAGPPRPTGIQTWDWHVELAARWHTLASRGGRHDVVGLTEDGILGKIGINSAGLALHFNILGHVDDRVGGIPVHVLAALVLEEAGSVAEAVELVRGAPLTSSGSFALFDESDAALLDLSPAGVFTVPPEHGIHVRTNHFLTPAPAAGEKTWLYQPDSTARRALVRSRLAEAPGPGHAAATDGSGAADELARYLVTGPGEAPVTCLPDPAAPFGRRWGSLATVALDPADRTARILDGTPADLPAHTWRVLTATAATSTG